VPYRHLQAKHKLDKRPAVYRAAMHLDRRGDLAAYRFASLPREGLEALVSTRTGGTSAEPYASLNLGLGAGDDPDAVIENRSRLLSAYGLDPSRSVWCRQTHSNRVAVVSAGDAGRGALDMDSAIQETDALVTDAIGLSLCVTVADCVPIAIYDPMAPAIAVVHAGWGGTASRIASRTVEVMQEQFGTDPARLLAGIGPSIGPTDYEVGDEVIDRVHEAYGPRASTLLQPGDGGKALLDLWRANSLDLEEAGVDPRNIEVAGISTATALDRFYSHRTEGTTGRFAAVVSLT